MIGYGSNRVIASRCKNAELTTRALRLKDFVLCIINNSTSAGTTQITTTMGKSRALPLRMRLVQEFVLQVWRAVNLDPAAGVSYKRHVSFVMLILQGG